MKRLPVYAFLAANAISMIGNMLTALAIPWFVLETKVAGLVYPNSGLWL